jgi:hypothetical protein
MTVVGPVCHIPPNNTIGDPQPQNLPGIPGPVNPMGNQQDINNAFAALLNALRLLLLQLANQRNGGNGTSGSTPDKNKPTWKEQSRVEQTVRVFQNNDPSSPNWVDVKQINQLTFADKNTGATWKWDRNRS